MTTEEIINTKIDCFTDSSEFANKCLENGISIKWYVMTMDSTLTTSAIVQANSYYPKPVVKRCPCCITTDESGGPE